MREIYLPYELSKEADTDLENIFDYTTDKFGFEQAVSYVSDLEDAFIQLSSHPQSGKDRSEIKQELRSIIKGSHTVFYRIMQNNIRIVRVLHTSRDVIRFFPPADNESH